LFSIGCGRLFEGTAAQMVQSLSKLSSLPADTLVFCAHEYTLANCAFALTVDPNNAALKAHLTRSKKAIDSGNGTLPSQMSIEIACNPFLRVNQTNIRLALGLKEDTDDVTTFATLRKLKDTFKPPSSL